MPYIIILQVGFPTYYKYDYILVHVYMFNNSLWFGHPYTVKAYTVVADKLKP